MDAFAGGGSFRKSANICGLSQNRTVKQFTMLSRIAALDPGRRNHDGSVLSRHGHALHKTC